MLRMIMLVIALPFTAFFLLVIVLGFIEGIDMTYLAPIRARKKLEKKLEQQEKERREKEKKRKDALGGEN